VGAADTQRVGCLLNRQWSFNGHGVVPLSESAPNWCARERIPRRPQQSTKAGVGLSQQVLGSTYD
jgi:hypothetical protein